MFAGSIPLDPSFFPHTDVQIRLQVDCLLMGWHMKAPPEESRPDYLQEHLE